MAEGGSPTSGFRSAVQKLIECSVCLEQYIDPRSLECRHTLCAACIVPLIQDGHVPCPLCRAVTELHSQDVTSLKRDLAIVNLLAIKEEKSEGQSHDSVKDQLQHRQTVCGLCEEIEPLVNYCVMCTLHLCRKCSKTHAKIKTCQQSDLLSIDVVIEQSKSKIKDIVRSVTDALVKFERVKDEIFNFDTRKAGAKEEIQSHVNEMLTAIDAEKVSLFNKVDIFYADMEREASNSKYKIEKNNTDLATLKTGLDMLRQFDTPIFIDENVEEVKDQLKAYTNHVNTASARWGNISGYCTFTKSSIKDIQLGSLEDTSSTTEATFQFVTTSNVSINRKSYSPKCMIKNLPWQIMIGPDPHHDYYAFYVICNGAPASAPWSCRASVELSMLNVNSLAAPHTGRVDDHLFSDKKNKWVGLAFNYTDINTLQHLGYIKDDTITLEAHVTIKAAQL